MKRFSELKDSGQRGSKPRCHLLTDGTQAEVAGRLTALVKPYGRVLIDHKWMPAGFLDVNEVQLHKPNALIAEETSRKLENWWFKVPNGSSPHWDLVSQCEVGRGKATRPGLLLVEAKAHTTELERGGKELKPGSTKNSCKNHDRIGRAIDEANIGLRSLTNDRRWALSRDNYYQMANRFAWAWKLVDLRIPVILVYLGFLDALEMSDKGDPLINHAHWVGYVKTHAEDIVPEDAWERGCTATDGSLFVPRIISVYQPLTAARI